VSDEYIALVRQNYRFINAIGRTDADFVDPEEVAPDLWARVAPGVELQARLGAPLPKVVVPVQARLERRRPAAGTAAFGRRYPCCWM
jgi:hypothetical protein